MTPAMLITVKTANDINIFVLDVMSKSPNGGLNITIISMFYFALTLLFYIQYIHTYTCSTFI